MDIQCLISKCDKIIETHYDRLITMCTAVGAQSSTHLYQLARLLVINRVHIKNYMTLAQKVTILRYHTLVEKLTSNNVLVRESALTGQVR